jgi:hypothetical protein
VGKDPLVFAEGAVGSPKMAEMDFPGVLLPVRSDWAIGQAKHRDETDVTVSATPREQLGSKGATWTKV